MKRIGAVPAAVGLIFLGAWIICSYFDGNIASQMFKWWPGIIILTGLELLFFFQKSPKGEVPKFSGLIIIVVIVFLFINGVQATYCPFNLFHWDMTIFGNHSNCLSDQYKPIITTKIIPAGQNKISFLVTNARFNLKKSQDNNIRIDAQIYVDKSSALTEWDMRELSDTNGVTIDLNDTMVKGVAADVYVPDGCSVEFVAKDLIITSTDAHIDDLSAESENGNLDLTNTKNIRVRMQNGRANIAGDSESVNINMGNGKIDIGGRISDLGIVMSDGKVNAEGNVTSMDIKIRNGKADIKNKSEKHANIELHDGVVNYETVNQDANVVINVINGVGVINGRKSEIGGDSTIFGSGSSKITMKVGNGKASFSNRE